MQIQRLETVITDLVITLDEAKQHLNVEHSDDDVLITRYVLAAIAFAEARTERTLRVRRYKAFGPCRPDQGVQLLYGPVRQIESVQYTDTDGAVQTLGTDLWQTLPYNGYQLLHFYDSPPWPKYGLLDAVSVTYLAGYGQQPGTTPDVNGFPYILPLVLGYSGNAIQTDVNDRLPDNIRQAIYMLIGHWYENRETAVVGTANSVVAIAAEDLLHQERILGV